jgi:hypothetical protein
VDPKVASSILVSHPKSSRAPLAQLVEHRTFNPLVPGSIPGGRTFFLPEELGDAPLAQLVEQVTLNHLVGGSSPSRCRIEKPLRCKGFSVLAFC